MIESFNIAFLKQTLHRYMNLKIRDYLVPSHLIFNYNFVTYLMLTEKFKLHPKTSNNLDDIS